jgi:phage FluMu protein Com
MGPLPRKKEESPEDKHDLRCFCGRLLARLVAGGVEIRCSRCKRSCVIALSEEGFPTVKER